MELTVKIGLTELMDAIRNLSPAEKQTVQSMLQEATQTSPTVQQRQFGTLKGLIVSMSDDFDAPLEDFNDYM